MPPSYATNTSMFAMRAAVVLVCGIMAVAARCVGIRHGEPDTIWHPDVAKQGRVAASVRRADLDLRRLHKDDARLTAYPYGHAVIAGLTQRLIDRTVARGRDRVEFSGWSWSLRLAQQATLLYVAALLALLWRQYRRWGPWRTALTGALLALEPLHAYYSHYGMNDVPLVAGLLLTWLLTRELSRERPALPFRSLALGFTLGVSFGIKYQAALAVTFPLAAWFVMGRQRRTLRLAASVAAVVLGGVAGVWLTCPLLRADPDYFLGALRDFTAWQNDIVAHDSAFWKELVRNCANSIQEFMAAGRWLLLPGLACAVWRGWHHHFRRASAPDIGAALFCAALLA
ncbi:MAG: glycosyltransferase family 39 protein, partial [Kiritimatiellae bacterium]|nr:glycosyltransferase family 39 protein [Kiritimatiellia bacterium]